MEVFHDEGGPKMPKNSPDLTSKSTGPSEKRGKFLATLLSDI
jgi:hypothetical protein